MSTNRSSSHNHRKAQPTGGATKGPFPESQDLDTLNKKLKRLADHVLPDSPYLLTVPTDVPFRLGSRFVSNWAVGEDRPFAPGEEHLQYMTFLSHQVEDSLLLAVGGWSDGNGNVMEEEDSKPASIASASTTPLSGGPPKKKISLNEYKNKSKETTTTNTPVVQRNEKIENGTTQPKEATSASKPIRLEHNAVDKSEVSKPKDISLPPKPLPPQYSADGSTEARKKPVDEPVQEPYSFKNDKPSTSSHPQKKPRLSPPPKIATKDTSTPSRKNTPNSVPKLLSPTLPPTTSSTLSLPRLLSPTLPPDIEVELTKVSNEPHLNSASSNHRRSASGNSSASKCDSATFKNLPKQRQHSSSTSSSTNKPPSSASTPPKLPSSTPKLGAVTDKDNLSQKSNKVSKPVEKQSSSTSKPPLSSNSTLSSAAKPSRIVKLKYGRANRKRVEALLKFTGKRKADTSAKQARAQELETVDKKDNGPDRSSSKPVESDQTRPAGARGEKRPRATDDHDKAGHSTKRPKASMNLNVPEKPDSPGPTTAAKSPSRPRQTSTSKSTPKKDIRSVAMRRVESADSDVKTPSGLGTGTPVNMEKSAKPSPPTSFDNPNNKSRDADWRAWREEFQKYAGLGRDLKHAASRQTEKNPSGADEKLAAVIAMEAIVCFILAFVADNQQKALTRQIGDSSTWRSILPYWNAVKRMTASYPQLHGLCLLLGAVSHDTIHGIDLERLSASALPCDHNPIPTPGSDGNTVLSDEGKKYKKDFLDLKARLSDHYKEAHRLWLDGSRELPDDVLAREFPKTWSKRSINFTVRGKQKLKIGEYDCEMFLPLGRTTTPIEAVRFGWSLLSEWCEKEGVKWTGRLGL